MQDRTGAGDSLVIPEAHLVRTKTLSGRHLRGRHQIVVVQDRVPTPTVSASAARSPNRDLLWDACQITLDSRPSAGCHIVARRPAHALGSTKHRGDLGSRYRSALGRGRRHRHHLDHLRRSQPAGEGLDRPWVVVAQEVPQLVGLALAGTRQRLMHPGERPDRGLFGVWVENSVPSCRDTAVLVDQPRRAPCDAGSDRSERGSAQIRSNREPEGRSLGAGGASCSGPRMRMPT